MKKHLNASYALYLSLYWVSACFVFGYTRLFLSRLGFSADEVGLLMALDCAASMALKPWIILLPGTVWGVYLMRFSHFFTFALFLLALTYYANERMAEDEKVTGQALITGAISLSGVFSYLFGGMLISGCGVLRSLLICTLIGMAGGALFLLFAVRDQKEKQ